MSDLTVGVSGILVLEPWLHKRESGTRQPSEEVTCCQVPDMEGPSTNVYAGMRDPGLPIERGCRRASIVPRDLR